MEKLYKYRRIAGIFLLAGAIVVGSNTMQPANNDNIQESYTVRPGDTLWSIASQRCSDEDNILEFIKKIKEENNISTSNLSAGQIIKISSRRSESQFIDN